MRALDDAAASLCLGVPIIVEYGRKLKSDHFLISDCQVVSATFLGAIISTLLKAKLVSRSEIAERVIADLPS